MEGKWWLVTWGTYGSWLPGDPRGFKTWRGHRYIPPPEGKSYFGEPNYNPAKYEVEHQLARNLTGAPVQLDRSYRWIAMNAIADDIIDLQMQPSILAVAAKHVHLLEKFGTLRIRRTVGRLKTIATQQLHEDGFNPKRPWAKNCDMESMPDEESFLQAFNYVRRHEQEDAATRIWRLEYADDLLPR